jgi:enoyl-CoA hydratase
MVLHEIREEIAILTINRPEKLNALNAETISGIHQELVAAGRNKQIKGIILTGAGNKAFVAGADIAEFSAYTPEQGSKLSRDGHELLFTFIETFHKPVLAAVNGFALGGGFELAMACHLRVASEQARFGLPELTLGLIPGYGGTQRLAQLAGKGRALEMILTADMIDAQKAYQWGIVNNVFAADQLMENAIALMKKITAKPGLALHAALKSVVSQYLPDHNGFETEIHEFGKLFGTNDFKEGVSAFLEKRKPAFSGS